LNICIFNLLSAHDGRSEASDKALRLTELKLVAYRKEKCTQLTQVFEYPIEEAADGLMNIQLSAGR